MTDIMEARRKGFERWINNQAFNPKLDVISAWQGYNAALDSVCVELPYPGHWSLDHDMVIEAIERAGLKVKP